ncbi:hypothetical protein PF010_g30093 [Phytophthora fragariae]|uniref:Uncharacterized protein n=1 Tax=Phytophthora fragariae TaxID=53985 RepID=A0A6A4B561_9STRA|nr:hypothetical protein PF007_g31218 [Phytophthora fragariae]KAE9060743.1 hypothetical protein PF010_g30093 [Phytophthora fragariae]KAE9065085.1 hypothetical protein PF006_g30539 [Phytophthora fragariae]KAE9268223.1 hypothetical protein PF001_g29743 [Phytophthora fragariae]
MSLSFVLFVGGQVAYVSPLYRKYIQIRIAAWWENLFVTQFLNSNLLSNYIADISSVHCLTENIRSAC